MEKKKSKKSHLNITGMHCVSCAQTIEKALKKHRGVKKANVNFATEKAYVVYDPNLTDKKQLIETLRSAGYFAHSETKKTIVKISGMTCASCAQTIENALKKLRESWRQT